MRRYVPEGFRDLLTNTTFRRLFVGRVITDTGDSLYYIGTMWLVWELTGSTLYTGIAGALVQVPNALRFLLGPLVDRWRLRRILLGTQVVNGVGVLIVPLAAWTGQLSVWVVLGLIPVLNFVNNLVYPAQNAALPEIVGDERLTAANSLFSTTLRTVDTAANAVAGGIIAAVGAVTLFLVDAVTFAAAGLLFAGVAMPSADADTGDDATEESDDGDDGGYLTELRAGFAYIRGSAVVAVLVAGMAVNFVSYGANAVMPAFADGLGGSGTYGLLLAGFGVGNFVGSGGAFLVDDYPFGPLSVGCFAVSGILWLLGVAVPGTLPTVALLAASMVPTGAFNVLLGSMIQSAVDTDYLGRVSSLMGSLVTAMMPAGALLGGAAAELVGTTTLMYGSGASSIVLAAVFLVHPALRSIPTVASANEASLGLGSRGDGDSDPA